MEDKCRKRLLRLSCALSFGSLVFFIIVCVLNLKPYLESQDYVQTDCVMDSKTQFAGEGSCDCGRRCTSSQECGAGYVNVPSTGQQRVLLSLDETQTSPQCTREGETCGSPYDVERNLPQVGATFSCLYDPDDHGRVILHHQAQSFLLPMLIAPAVLFVLFTAWFCGLCCCSRNKSLSVSSGDTSFGFSRFHNQAI